MNDVRFGSTDYWLARTRAALATFDAALHEHGYQIDADLPVVADISSTYCYYHPDARVLSMGFPDLHNFIGRMRWTTYLPLFGTNDVDEVARATDILLPVFAVHEAAHHLRHRYGRMTREDPWTEEHAANALTVAYLRTRPHWPADVSAVLRGLDQMRHNAENLEPCPYVHATHFELLDVLLYEMRAFDRATYDHAYLVAQARGRDPLGVLEDAGIVNEAMLREANERQRIAREQFNREYGGDLLRSTILAVAQLQVKIVDRQLPSFAEGLAYWIGRPS